MSSRVHEIPVLPSVVALSVVAFGVLPWWLRRRTALTVPRVAVSAVASVYVAGVIGTTLLPIRLGREGSDLRWWEYPHLTPLVGYEAFDMIQDIAVFVPLGVLLPLVARVASLPRVLLWAFLVSLTMELLQWVDAVVAHGGHLPDVNDLLFNTLGAPTGYGVYRAALLLPAAARLAAVATWPAPARVETHGMPVVEQVRTG